MIPSFDWFVLALSGVASTHGVGEALLIAATSAVFGAGLSDIASGLTERLSGDDAAPEDTGEPGFDGDNQGDGDGFDGDLDDEEFGDFDDWDDEGGELDDWDDDDGDLDGLGGDSGGSSLEPRLDELENEMATITSTIGTVRSENEAITEAVEDVEDNIRKLLDIYEMVTRGVNPFVDDAPGGGGVGGSFGLFDDADEDGFDDLDPDVAGADADSFFDDDFEEDGFDDEFGEEDFDDDPEIGATEDDDPHDGRGPSTSAETGSDGDGEGKTFEELKSEYEAGGVDWDEDRAVDEDEEDADAPANAETSIDVGDARPAADIESPTDPAPVDDAGESTGAADPSPRADPVGEDAPTASEADRGDGDGDQTATSAPDGKPHLESLPSGYGAELLVIEWLSYLRGRSSTSEALRAIEYYETIEWIGTPAANSLQRYLAGLADEDVTPATSGGTQLTIDHHTDSLRYIGKLGGKHVDVERLEWTGAGRDGSRVERRGQRGIQR